MGKCITFSVSIFSTEGHLGFFQLLAIINKAAMNIVQHVSLLYVKESFKIVKLLVRQRTLSIGQVDT